MTVNKDRVRLLVEALRSGKYPQGTGALERIPTLGKRRYCCLGVACRVAMENGVKVSIHESRYTVHFDGASGVMPRAVYEWYGFDTGNPVLEPESRVWVTAVDWNDAMGANFSEIADAFESMYLT